MDSEEFVGAPAKRGFNRLTFSYEYVFCTESIARNKANVVLTNFVHPIKPVFITNPVKLISDKAVCVREAIKKLMRPIKGM